MKLTNNQIEQLSQASNEPDNSDLSQSLYRAARKNPDQQVNIIDMSTQQRIPVDTVERNQPELTARQQFGDIDPDEIQKNFPALADYLRDANNAAVSIDDIDNLKGLETELSTPETGFWSNSIRGGVSRLNELVGNLMEAGGTIADDIDVPNPGIRFGADGLSWSWDLNAENATSMLSIGGRYLSQGKAHRVGYVPDFTWEKLKGDVTPTNLAGYIIEQGVKSLPDMAATIATLPAYVASRTEEIAEARVQSDRRGDVETGDLIDSVVTATVVSLIERIGAKAVFDLGAAKTAADVGKAAGEAFLKEGATEFIQEGIEYYGETVGTRTPVSHLAALDRALAGLVAGAPMGGGIRGTTATIEAVNNRVQKNSTIIGSSMNEQEQVDRIVSLAQSSTTGKRAQDQFQTFLRGAGKDRLVYVPATEIQNLTEQGFVLPRYITEQTVNIDSDVEIPMDRFATDIALDEELMEAIRPFVRLSTGNLSANELEQGTEESVKSLLEKASKAADLKTEADVIYEEVKGQLVATGRQSEETAKWSASIIPAYATVKAEQLGITPSEVYKTMGFRVTDVEAPPDGEVLSQLMKPPVVDGDINLTHFSKTKGLSLIDPSYYGSNYAGAERQRSMQPDWINRSYYGIAVGEPGGYKKEAQTGQVRYDVLVKDENLYDFQKNSDDLPQTSINSYEKAIHDAGYIGYWVPHPQIGMVAAVFDPLDVSLTQAPKRYGTTGQYRAAPKGIDSPQKLGALRRRIRKMVDQGVPGRYWYEQSSESIMKLVGGDINEADKLSQLISIYSPQSNVDVNFNFAAEAYQRYKAGHPIVGTREGKKYVGGIKTQGQDEKAILVMEGKPWPEGITNPKTTNFYNNLMVLIDPSRMQGATIDVQMMRSFGYPTDTPTLAQYNWIENELNRIADDLGDDWTAHQVQATVWVTQKSIKEDKPTEITKFDFGDAAEKRVAQISWESTPGDETTRHLQELVKASSTVRTEYHQAIIAALTDQDGGDLIAKALGLPSLGIAELDGYWHGVINPGAQTLAVTASAGNELKSSTVDMLDAYAIVKGLVLRQEAVAWHRPFYKQTLKRSNGVEIKLGRPLSEKETRGLAELMGEDYSPTSTRDGVRLINYDEEVNNRDFHKLIQSTLDEWTLDDDTEYEVVLFQAQSNYLSNDWKENPNGEGYYEASKAGRSDLQKWVNNAYTTIRPKIEAVEEKYIEEFGWTPNRELGPKVDPSLAQEDRAQLIKLPDGQLLMELGKKSDWSSFLHESAHVFLETERKFADQYGVTDDQQALLKWLGAESFDDIKFERGDPMHERFAQGFEDYLAEGKAPSLGLRRAFESFKRWLVKLYQNIRQADVPLTNEIREVFDRMLATEAEITEALATPAYDQYFQSKEQAGMTDAEWEKYQKAVAARHEQTHQSVDAKVMAEYKKRRTAEWNEEKQPLIDEETERLSKEPVYQIMSDLAGYPMDYEMVLNALDVTKMPGRLGFGKTVKTDGIDPQEYAEVYSYHTVKKMLDDILTAPTLKKAAGDAAQARMIEKYGDILNDGTIEMDVQEALHNDAQAEILLTELKAFGKPINREYLKAEARLLISTMTYREIQPNKFYRAEIRAAKRAVTDKDPYDAKVQQLVNHYLYREAVDTRKAMERYRRYVKQVQTRKYDNKVVDPQYVQNMKTLANLYDLKSPQAQQVDVNSLLNWYQTQISDPNEFVEIQLLDPNLVLALKAKRDDLIPNLVLPKFDDLTASDLRGMYEMLRHLRFVGGQVSDVQSNEILAERVELNESIISKGGRDLKDPTTPGRKAPELDAVKHFFNKILSLRNLIRKLDGNFQGQDEGAANRLIYRRIEDATNDRLDLSTTMYDRFKDELDGIHNIGLSGSGVTGANDVSITLESGNTAVMNPEEMFMLALYWGTESSREAIREGHGMTDFDVHNMMENLTNEQLKMVNSVWKVNESMWPELSSASVKRYGVAPEKLDPTPFEVNGVELTGGHMRLFYNSLELDLKSEQQRGEQYATIMPTKAGSLHERIGSGGRPVLLDRNNIIRSMEDNIHFIAFAETGQRIRRIVNARDIQASIQRKHGDPFHQALIEQLDMLIRNKKERDAWPFIAKTTRLLRRAATYRHLMGSVRNVVQQVSALPIAAAEVGPTSLINSYVTFVSDGGAAKNMVLQKSAFMRNRTSLVNREAAEYLRQLSVDNKFQYMWEKFAATGFVPQTFIDSLIAFPTWLAKYEQGINEHGNERRAVSDADVSVSESVGSGADIHLGGAFNSNAPEYIRTLTVFGSWFNAYYQRMYRDTNGYTQMTPAGFNSVFTLPLISGVLAALLVMDYPDDDSEEGWVEYAAKRYAGFIAGTVPLFRDIISFFISGFGPKTVLAGGQEAPVRAIQEAEAFFEGRQTALKTASDITKAVTTFVPVPYSGEVTRVADYLDSYYMGKEGKFNAYQMLVEGPDKNR